MAGAELDSDLGSINIAVQWPSGRVVSVHVDIEPYLVGVEPIDVDFGDAIPLTDAELETRATLLAALAEATRPVAAGAIVEAVCFETYLGALYKALEVEPPAPDPVEIRLPPDA
jgi:hypothetical protein